MFLLDTNVVSELRKVRSGKADHNVAAWATSAPGATLFVSAIVIFELELGVLLIERRDPRQGVQMRTWFERQVMDAFADRILAIDAVIARRCATLHVPNPRPVRDGLIAATAWVHGLTVVTRNVIDFTATGVSVLNPWEAR